MAVDVKAVRDLQSRILAAAQGFDITDLEISVTDKSFSVVVKGAKKA